jgi:hypothetical protein
MICGILPEHSVTPAKISEAARPRWFVIMRLTELAP